MKLMLKVVVALSVLMAATVAYAEVPDVSKWSCQNATVLDVPNYGVVVTICGNDNGGSFYAKVSGELFYIHEHRMDADKAVYYNALKTGDWWVEVVNKKDLAWVEKTTENGNVEVSIIDDNGAVIAKRIVPLLKK